MFSLLISLLVYLLILSLLYWAATLILNSFGAPAPIHTVVKVIFILIGCSLILGVFMNGVPPLWR